MRSSDADIVLKVRRPTDAEARALQARRAGDRASWTPTATRPRSPRWPKAGVVALRDGVDAAHHPRAVDGRAVEPGQPRRLPRRDRRRRRVRPGLPMMMTAAGTVPAAQSVHHGRRRRRPAGDRDRAPARRHRHRDRRAARDQGAGGKPRRQVHRRRGRGVQAGRRPPAATPRRCRRSTRPSRPSWSPSTSRSRTSSSPPR